MKKRFAKIEINPERGTSKLQTFFYFILTLLSVLLKMLITVGDVIDKIITNKIFVKSFSAFTSFNIGEIPKNPGQMIRQIEQSANITTNTVEVKPLNGLHNLYSIAIPVYVNTIVAIVVTSFIL